MMVARGGHGFCVRTLRLCGAAVYRRAAWLVGLLACAGALALGASPASAILIHLKSGKELGYQPVLGKSAVKSPSHFDSFFSNLDYSGGPVMASNTNYVVEWDPSGGSAFQSGYISGVAQYFTDLAHDSGQATNSDAVSTQYNDSGGHTAAYSSSFGGTLLDTDALPANGCPALPGDICLTDAQLQSELDSFLTSKGLPRDLSHEYFLLTPPAVASCFDAAGSACSGNADLNLAYCAYHSYSSTPSPFIYANIPDLDGLNGCDPYATVSPCDINFCEYPNGAGDGVLAAISHEHNESTTDPQPNNAWTDFQPGCFPGDRTCGGEIGDKCTGGEASGTDPNENDNLQLDGKDAPFNQTLNGRHYWLQPEYSNQTHQCLDSFTANSTTVHASFTDTVGLNDVVNFDASASTATGPGVHYVWQFNDDVIPGDTPQQNTVETTSPKISHTFPQGGTYTVALTVMASDGTSSGTAHAVNTVIAPTNISLPTISGTPQQGQTLAVANGAWTENPSSFSHHWEDCDSSGNNCALVAGATSPTYTLGARDVGHTVRVTESATNSAGTSGAVASLPTATVAAPPPPPVAAPPPPPVAAPPIPPGGTTAGAIGLGSPRVSGQAVDVVIACKGATGAACSVTLNLTVVETIKVGKVIAVSSRAKKKTVVLGSASVTLTAGHSASLHLVLNRAGKALLAKRRVLSAKLAALQSGQTIATARVTFRSKRKR